MAKAGLRRDRPRPQPERVECMGGCGKFQMTRPRRDHAKWTLVGCGKCEGWRAKEAAIYPVPEGMVVERDFQAVAGFEGVRVRIGTMEERASIARARALRDAALAAIEEERA